MAFWQNKIYPNLPIFAQNWSITAYGYSWQKRRFGGIFSKELKEAKEREAYSLQQWRDYQTVELRKLLVHAFDTVPFYREKYGKAGFKAEDFRHFELEDLSKLPFLEKEELRTYGRTSLLSKKPYKSGEFFASSGSTGTPTSIYFTPHFHQQWSALFEARIRHWAGVDRLHPRGMIGGRRVKPDANSNPPFHRYNAVEKQVYFSAYHISPNTVPFYVAAIQQHKLKYMTGYAVSNFILAKMGLDANIAVPSLKAVITSSEKLTPEMRETFHRFYGCKSYDSYSGVEACGLISENQDGELLVSPDAGIMELLDEAGKNISPGETGEIVSTGLLNYDQPLIRYRIGDMAKLANNQSTKSGINFPVIEEISGRVEDKVVGPDGREMVRFHGLYINLPGLVVAQLIQEKVDNFRFNLVVDGNYEIANEGVILKRLQSQLGDVKAHFEYLSEIPKTQNGKFKAVISKINQI